MMTRGVLYLGGLLGLQLLAALIFAFSSGDDGAFKASEPLLAVAPSSVTTVEIAAGGDGAGAAVTLARAAEGWVLPALGDFPADAPRVDRMVEQLAALKRGWPAAETAGGAERLRVSAEDFERRVALRRADGAAATLILGASPSFRQVYARRDDEATVYTVGFEAADAPAEAAAWARRDLLALDAATVSEIALGSIRLVTAEGRFALADLAEGETVDAVAVDGLVAAALARSYDSVGAPAEAAALDMSAPLLDVTVKTVAGETLTARYVADPTDETRAIFTVSDRPQLFRVSRARAERLLAATRVGLLQAAAAPTPEPAPQGDPAAPTPEEPEAAAEPAASQ